MAMSLFDKERITTTTAKAKEVRGVVERLITYGKIGTLHAIRTAAKTINDKDILKKLFKEIAPGYKDRQGGYTRVVKLKNRRGDNAELSIIELVGRGGSEVQRRRKKKSAAKKAKPAAGVSQKEESGEDGAQKDQASAKKKQEPPASDPKVDKKES
jgi:large subunit ribosomal protein L17